MKTQSRRRVLVAYASKYGSTRGVAEAIGKTLCNNGYSVDIVEIAHNGTIKEEVSEYDTIVFGAPVQKSQWVPELGKFLKRYKDELTGKATAAFVTCLTLSEDEENKEKQQKVLSFIKPVLERVPEVKPEDIGLFAGELDYSKYNFMIKKIMKSIMEEEGLEEGDYRNWERIKEWADTVGGTLE